MKIVEANQDFGITLFLKSSLLKIASFMILLIGNSRTSSFEEGGTDIGELGNIQHNLHLSTNHQE